MMAFSNRKFVATEALNDSIEGLREIVIECESILDGYTPGDEMSMADSKRVYDLVDTIQHRARCAWFHRSISVGTLI